jgi:hypothetical protein
VGFGLIHLDEASIRHLRQMSLLPAPPNCIVEGGARAGYRQAVFRVLADVEERRKPGCGSRCMLCGR